MPFEVPSGWVWTTLGSVCNFENGFAFSSDDYKQTGVPLIRISNISDNTIDLNGCVFIQKEIDDRFVVKKGDLLIALSGATTGKMGVYSTDKVAYLNQRVGNLRTIDTSVLCHEYRNIFMNSRAEAILKLAYGGAQPNISGSVICSFSFPLPPLAEQQRIASEVNHWFALIDQIEQGKSDLQTIIKQAKSKILNLAIHGKLVPQDPNDEPAIELLKRINPDFTPCDNGHYTQLPEGWAICKMKQITSITNGKSQKNVETLNGIYPIYGSGGVIGRANQYLCIAGSTIIGRKGTINNPIFVEEHFWNVDTAFGLKANDAILDKYLYYFCLSFDFSKLDKSTAMPSLTKTSIGNVLIPIPPYKEQERIVAKIDMVLDTMNEILRAV